MTTSGLTAFRKIALGPETTKGTIVPPTYKMHGTCTVTPGIEWHTPVDEDGTLAEFRRDRILRTMSRVRFESDLDFENGLYVLNNAVKGTAAGVLVAGSAPAVYDWDFTPAIDARSNPLSFSWYYGDDETDYVIPFAIAENLELSWAAGDSVKVRHDLFGQLAATPVTANVAAFDALTDRDIVEVLTHEVTVKIADTYATVGAGTDIAESVLGGTIRLRTNYMPKRNVQSDDEFSYITEARRHLEMDIDFRATSDWVTEYDRWLSAGLRAVEVAFTGADDQSFICTAVGRYMGDPNLYDDSEGENTVRMSLHSRRVGSNHFGFSVVSALGTTLI